jgi:hypothetical protein
MEANRPKFTLRKRSDPASSEKSVGIRPREDATGSIQKRKTTLLTNLPKNSASRTFSGSPLLLTINPHVTILRKASVTTLSASTDIHLPMPSMLIWKRALTCL